jgi:PAS domain S-box-containing protein
MSIENEDLSSRIEREEPRQAVSARVLDELLAYVCVLDPDGRITQINRPALEACGSERENVIGSRFWECSWWTSDFDTKTAIERAFTQAAAGRAARWAARAYIGGNKRPVWLDLKLAPILDAAGNVDAIVVSAVDITQRQQAEDALRESRTELELALTAGRGGVWDWDIVNDVTRVSPSYRELYGHAPDEELSYDVWLSSIVDEDRERVRACAEEFFKSGRDWSTEYRVIHPVHGERWLAAVGVLRRDESGRPIRFLGINVDITDRKRAEQALIESNRRKDEFLAVLGHELRNPLAPLRTGLELLEMGMPPEEVAEVYAMMARQVDHLSRLVDDLLDLSRITRGTVQLQVDTVDLNEVVDIAVELARPRIEERRHRLLDERERTPLTVKADAQRLAQVVSNVLDNAAKYTEPGGEIRLWLDVEPAAVSIHVQDTGLGIPVDQLDTVFEMFSQVREHHVATGGGALGIGLALSRQLLALHGGTIEAMSEGLDCGSEFVIRLPLDRIAQGDQTARRAPETTAGLRRVLVVDDNRDAAAMVGALLEVPGHEVRIAHDAQEALEVLATFEPEVVLLDIGLPGMDGYEAARRIRALPCGKKVLLIALTGWGKEEDKRRALEAGFDEHLTKPVSAEQLLDLLARQGLERC